MGNFTRSGKLAVRKTRKARGFYSRSFLFRELLPAAERCNDTEFAKFHIDALNESLEGFNISSITTSLQQLRCDGSPENYDFHVVYNVSKIGKEIYKKTTKYDLIKELTYNNTGRAILNSDIMPLRNWIDTELYHYLKLPLGIHQSATLMYRIPFKKYHRFKIICFSDFSKTFDASITADEIEFLSMPLFFGWLRRIEIIDSLTLTRWFELLVGMTPMRLAMLREMVNIGRYQNTAIARKLDVSDRVVSNYISEAYDHISHQLPSPEFGEANLSRCVDLVRCYSFLSLVGASTNEFEFL